MEEGSLSLSFILLSLVLHSLIQYTLIHFRFLCEFSPRSFSLCCLCFLRVFFRCTKAAVFQLEIKLEDSSCSKERRMQKCEALNGINMDSFLGAENWICLPKRSSARRLASPCSFHTNPQFRSLIYPETVSDSRPIVKRIPKTGIYT